MAANTLYPAHYLNLPLHVQHRLPPALQNVDLESVLVAHAAVALFSSFFWVHTSYALPLALFGLLGTQPALLTSLLPHFLALWIASIVLDVAWLVHRADQARSIIIILTGANMLLKLVSASQAARILQSHGIIADIDESSFGARSAYGNGGGPWLNNRNSSAQPFGLPGSWSAAGGQAASPYRDGHAPQQQQSSAYRSVYDEEANAQEDDAPQVRVENVASSVAAAAAAAAAAVPKEDPNRSAYRSTN